MAEERIVIHSGVLRIEGLFENLPGEKGVVVTHPHPLYGGDMHNHVVETVCRAYREKGYSSLRFNFRGVGGSDGEYNDGKGEQEDVCSAIEFIHHFEKKEIDLVGYSFGAWVNMLAMKKLTKVKRMIMVSPPVDMMDFSFVSPDPRIKLIIAGTKDEFGDIKTIRDAMRVWNPDADLRMIEGADHFYLEKTALLKSEIEGFLDV